MSDSAYSYYLLGRGFNLMSRGVVTVSPGSNSLYLPANLYDGKVAKPWIASAASANPYIQVDVNLLLDPGFESGVETSWPLTSGTTSVLNSPGQAHSGTYVLKFEGITAMQGQTIYVRPGERIKVGVWVNRVAADYVRLYIYNPLTGKYLNTSLVWTAGIWSDGPCYHDATSVGYTDISRTTQIESFSVTNSDWIPLEFRVLGYRAAGSLEVYVDDAYVLPGHNFMSVHGSNLTPAITPQYRSSTDAFVGVNTLQATMSLARPTFFSYLANVSYDRWVRLYLSGTPYLVPRIGEMVLGYAETILRSPMPGYTETEQFKFIELESQGGDVERLRLSDDGSRRLKMSMKAFGSAEWDELKAMNRRTFGGESRMVFVPYNGENVAMYGRLINPIARNRPTVGYSEVSDLEFLEAGFPVTSQETP